MQDVPEVIAALDAALYAALYGEGVPEDLVARWEREGPSAWPLCQDPAPLLRILVQADSRLGVRAASACARTVLARLSADDRTLAVAALDLADAWGRGADKTPLCRAAGLAAMRRATDLAQRGEHPDLAQRDEYAACALFASAHAAYAAHAASEGVLEGAADHASVAAHTAACRVYEGEPDAGALRELASVVRSIADCPHPAQLTSGAGGAW